MFCGCTVYTVHESLAVLVAIPLVARFVPSAQKSSYRFVSKSFRQQRIIVVVVLHFVANRAKMVLEDDQRTADATDAADAADAIADATDAADDAARDVFKAISADVSDGLWKFYKQHDVLDEHGMTPLQHAAYNGNERLVRWLLDRDVDSGEPMHQDTGAESELANAVGGTASGTDASVGNNNCVVVISNHVPEEDVMCYTLPETNDSEPLLPPALAKPVHKFIMMTNIHPVKVALEVPPVFLANDNASKIYSVLNLMCEREMERNLKTSELMAFKFFYLANVLMEISKNKQSDPKELFIKKVLKNDVYLEHLMMDCIVNFHFRKPTIFGQMVTSKNQGKDTKTVFNELLVMIGNGHSLSVDSFDKEQACTTCAENNATNICGKCQVVQYCDQECQRMHWFVHRKECNRMAANNGTSQAYVDSSRIAESLAEFGININFF